MKRFILMMILLVPLLGSAQVAKDVDFSTDGDKVIISYRLTAPASEVTVFLSEDGGSWQPLNAVSGDVGHNVSAGNKRVVWDVFSERPTGITGDVSFAVVPNYKTPTADQLPPDFPKKNMVIVGNKAYAGVEKILAPHMRAISARVRGPRQPTVYNSPWKDGCTILLRVKSVWCLRRIGRGRCRARPHRAMRAE